MIAIVCGGRDYDDATRIQKVMDAAVDRLSLHTIIEGGAGHIDKATGRVIDGADLLAMQWAKDRGDVAWIEVPATWGDGRSNAEIGHARNQLMLTMLLRSPPDEEVAVIAFPGGGGTAHMCKIAERANVRIIKA